MHCSFIAFQTSFTPLVWQRLPCKRVTPGAQTKHWYGSGHSAKLSAMSTPSQDDVLPEAQLAPTFETSIVQGTKAAADPVGVARGVEVAVARGVAVGLAVARGVDRLVGLAVAVAVARVAVVAVAVARAGVVGVAVADPLQGPCAP